MDTGRKKELRDAYRARPVTGGVCRIRCSGSRRVWLQPTRNVEGLRNRFLFAQKTNTCPDPSVRREWQQYGSEAFSFDVLEEIEKGENQTDREFAADIDLLYEMWRERSEQSAL